MACGGCGKRRREAQIKRDIYINPNRKTRLNRSNKKWQPPHAMVSPQLCPQCGAPLRTINQYDRISQVVVRKRVCVNPSCTNK